MADNRTRSQRRWAYFAMMGQLRLARAIFQNLLSSPLVSSTVQNHAALGLRACDSALYWMRVDYETKPKGER